MSPLPEQDPLDVEEASVLEEAAALESTDAASEPPAPVDTEFQGISPPDELGAPSISDQLPLLVDSNAPEQASPGLPPHPVVPEPLPEWVGESPLATEPLDQNQPELFQHWSAPPVIQPGRTPNFGDLGILTALGFIATLASIVVIWSAVRLHLFGVTNMTDAATDVHYALASEVSIYFLTLLACLLLFPILWHKGFFAGLQWNASTAIARGGTLLSAAIACVVLALVNGMLLPGPDDAPIDKIFRSPGAAWLMFAFGVTVAPFFEEIAFRGFLLPAFCTAWDWSIERTTHQSPPPLGAHGHPQWSTLAMVIGSILTSVPFAAMHAEQTGYSIGPFVLLVGVSLVLCWARLSTRSLAASVLVHASYNFLLFSLMLIGTGGFKHLDKM